MRLFKKEPPPREVLATHIPFPKYRNYIEIQGFGYWQCNRCGGLIADSEVELHHSFHTTQDRLLEKLLLALEKVDETPHG